MRSNVLLVEHPGFLEPSDGLDLLRPFLETRPWYTRVGWRHIVGAVGQTGRVTGPNLHFEVRRGISARDPMRYLPRVRQAKKVTR